jgi:protein-disulfide isomerase
LNGKTSSILTLASFFVVVSFVGIPWMVLRANPQAQGAAISDAARGKILNYIRERFGVPESVHLSLGPLHRSPIAPGFNEATVSVDEGKNHRGQLILISKDSRYLIVVMGSVIDLRQNSTAEMAQRIHESLNVPANFKIKVGGFKHSVAPDFEQGTLTYDDGKSKQERGVLLSRDGKHLLVSDIFNLGVDPREQAVRTISLRNEPSQGPSNAPVTIVEFADLECPTCARMHEFLETKLVPHYGNKVRVVFKEFPLVGVHEWSETAAIACQCAYELNPPSYVPLRSAIFRSQQNINVTNLRDTLLSFGEQAGVNRVRLAGCLDAKSTLPRVQHDLAEGKRVNVDRTPTFFINGKMIVGLPSEDEYFHTIDEILGKTK